MDEREAVNRAAAEHVERLRQRLQEGKLEIARQRAVLGEARAFDDEAASERDYDDAA